MLNRSVEAVYGCAADTPILNPPSPKTFRTVRELFDDFDPNLSTQVGIEIEIENMAKQPQLPNGYWRFEADASLRNNGIELVSKPLHSADLLPALAHYKLFLDNDPALTFSHRCSIHVHLNASTLTMEQLYVLVGTYLSVEHAIFSLFPQRKGNNYCFPLSDVMFEALFLSTRHVTRDTWKYAAINCYHLRDFGTLEFRHHPGTKNVHDLLNWVMVLNDLYRYAQNTKINTLIEVLGDLNTTSGYHQFLTSAVPHLFVDVRPDMMYNSVTAAKYFLNSIKG